MSWTTPDLCDDHPDVLVVDPVFRSYGGRAAFHGRIVTIHCFEDNSRVRELANTPGEGRVIVVDGGGSVRRALLGDQIAAAATRNGWSGLLIHGAVRDVDALAETDMGVQALASHPMKTDKRGLGDVDVTVTFAGVTFEPGEWLYADRNGVIVSPRSLLD